jgi:hypothetical protein
MAMLFLRFLLPLSLLLTITACNRQSTEHTDVAGIDTAQQTPTGAAAPVKPCIADKTWFDGHFDPGKNAAAFTGGSLCAFHQFSWQTFIWLTDNMADGKLRFDTLYADSAITPEGKPGNHVLGGVNQAGSNGILVDQNGRAVYTTMMVNDIYRDFVIQNKLYTKQGMLAADSKLNFPDGAMSLKAAWKIVQPNENTNGLFTMMAPVQMLSVVNGNVTIAVGAKQNNLKVALVGFHIAVYVNNHPEAIWATFEQVRNAPDYKNQQSPNDPVSADNFTFYHGGTLAKDCNANNSGMNAILQLNTTTQVMQNVSQASLQFPMGTIDSTPQADDNRKAITELNASVHELMPANSVWKNYAEIGAVWFIKANALTPDWNPNTDDSLLIGSTRLSNSTIETFTQNVRGQNECFGCHNTMALTSVPGTSEILPGKNVNTSHILLKNYIDGNTVKR